MNKEVKKTKVKKTVAESNKEKKLNKKTVKITKQKYIENITSVIEQFNHNGKKTVALLGDSFYPFVDGVVSVIDNYAKRLQKEFNVIVCAPRYKNNYIEKEYPVLYFKSVLFPAISTAIGQPSTDSEFLKLFKSLHVDIIHVHSPFMVGKFGLKEAKRRDIPIIATFHSQFKKDFQRIVKLDGLVKMLLSMIMEVFNNVTEVWTMNEASKKTLDSYNFTGQVRIIPNATDFDIPQNLDEFALIAQNKYDIKPTDNIYCFVGRLVFLKNIVLVAQSMGELKKLGVPFKMFFVGDGQDRAILEQTIKDLKLQDQVFLLGKILDKQLLGSILYNSKVMIFPSIYDTDGIVKYEAAAYKTPTLFLKNSNASYDIIDNETGFICEGDPKVIAKRLAELYDRPEEITRVGKNAREKVYHNWDEVISKAESVYNHYIDLSKKEVLTKKQKARSIKNFIQKTKKEKKLKKKIKQDLL